MPENKQPNLLYIISDQHSPSILGCYGDPLVETPNLDRLAGRGVLFTDAYCPSPICVPSRMSILTAREPWKNEVWTNDHILDSGIPTFAHAMGAAGYHPVLVGRMHSLGPDQLHGYAERLVGDHSSNYSFTLKPAGPKTDRGKLAGTAGPRDISLIRSGIGQSGYQVHDEDVKTAAIDLLNRIGAYRKTGRNCESFSLSVGFMLPHQPYVAWEEDFEMYRDRIAMPETWDADPENQPQYIQWWREKTGVDRVKKEDQLRARAAYYALVTRMDRMIGEILEALHRNNLEENTMIVYTSDHGELAGEHGLWWKHTFYESSVKVPMILSWPGVIPASQVCNRVISSMDLTATVLDALGAYQLPNSDGRSFLSLIDGTNEHEWEDIAFSEYCTYSGFLNRMVRCNRWKMIYYHGRETRLYDLEADPDQEQNLYGKEGYEDIIKRLEGLIFEGWDPETVEEKMKLKGEQVETLSDWANEIEPEEKHLWAMDPGINRLDE